MNSKITLILFFILGICHFINAQIVNKGVLKISSSTDVYFQDEYTNTATGNHVNDGGFYLNNNFINNGITSAASGTSYFKSATNALLTISGESDHVNFYNLEIDITAVNKKGVSVANNFSLNVANALNFKSGDLRLTGKSQLTQEHAGTDNNVVVSGKLLIDQQGNASPYQYDYWSSPVNNGGTYKLAGGKFDGTDSSLNPFDPTQILFTSGSPYNGLPGVIDGLGNVTTAATINTRWLYKYARGSGAYSEWTALNSGSALSPGEAYTMKGTNAVTLKQNYVYYGSPNNGDYQFPITSGESVLIGNPYPSALDSEKFINDNLSILEALNFWVDGGSTSHTLSDYLGGYAVRNLTGGTPPSIASTLISGIGDAGLVTAPSQYIPIGKGFFVDAIASGNIVFNNSQRIFSLETSRNSSGELNGFIRLGHEGPEGFHRQLLLGFLPNSSADLGFNPGYDAIELSPREDDTFFVIDQDETKRYVIQGVNAYSELMEFPLGIIISQAGTHQYMLDSVENFSDTVYIRDNDLQTTHNLTESNFEINLPPGEYLNKYSLVFQPETTLAVSTSELFQVNIFYNGEDQLVITNPDKLKIISIDVYNLLGQRMKSFKDNLSNQPKLLLPFNESKGVYLIILNTNNSKKSTKILKY